MRPVHAPKKTAYFDPDGKTPVTPEQPHGQAGAQAERGREQHLRLHVVDDGALHDGDELLARRLAMRVGKCVAMKRTMRFASSSM